MRPPDPPPPSDAVDRPHEKHSLHLDHLPIPMNGTIWVLAPHPDDFDAIGVSLLRLHGHGYAIHLSVVTSGASGVLDEEDGPQSLEAKGHLREQEQRRSCRFFGLPEDRVRFLRLQEDAQGDPVDSPENQAKILSELTRLGPTLVCLPHGHDTNAGHRRTYAMLRRLLCEWPDTLTVLLARDPKTLEMRVDLYCPFGSDEARWKAELLRTHASQEHRNQVTRGHGFDKRILDMNQDAAIGLPGDPAYAEVFEIERYGPGSSEAGPG